MNALKNLCSQKIWALLVAVSVGLFACGFQPLGYDAQMSAPHSIALSGNINNEIIESLKEQKPANINVAPPENADLVLDIGDITSGKTTISQTALGVTSEYRVSLSIVIQAYDHNQNQLLRPTRLTTYRNLIVGNGYATAVDAELERLNTDMARELANSIIYRMRAVWFARTPTTNISQAIAPNKAADQTPSSKVQ